MLPLGLFKARLFSATAGVTFLLGFVLISVPFGGLISGVGLLLLTGLGAGDSYLDVFWKLMLVGIGFGLMLSPLSTAALNAVSRDRAGLASSVANTTRQTGNVIGIALLGALVQTRAVAAASASLRSLPAPVAGPLADVPTRPFRCPGRVP
jgi:hypothetical protein